MKLLQTLSQHLLDNTKLKREQIHSFADNGELEPIFEDLGHGYTVGRYKYDAVFQLERYKGNAFELLALVNCWLDEHDDERVDLDLAAPEINVELNDRHTCDVELIIEFDEPIEIIRDPKGPIHYRGERFKVDTVPVDVAEELKDFEPMDSEVDQS